MVHVRFAPSPTGRLHPGNARTALINALFARRHGGRLTLRLDDTDTAREEAGAVDAIRSDLAWLGLKADAERRQSAHAARYAEAARDLIAAERAYDDAGAVRLRFQSTEQRWDDAVHGPMRIALAHLKAPVLVRSDGTPTYTLASVVDDIDMAVTHVIRGDDHLTNTAVQLELTAAIGATPPAFAHLPLVVDAAGAPLSKRTEALTLQALRTAGIEPEPLVAYLAGLGTGRTLPADEDVAQTLELSAFGRAAPAFDAAELARAQERWIEQLDVTALNTRRELRGLGPIDARLWQAVRGNLAGHGPEPWAKLARLAAVDDWQAVLEAPLTPVIAPEDAAALATAAELLADAADPQAWLEQVTAATGRKGKRLRLPIRLALTARRDGPPLADLLALIGHARARLRLQGKHA